MPQATDNQESRQKLLSFSFPNNYSLESRHHQQDYCYNNNIKRLCFSTSRTLREKRFAIFFWSCQREARRAHDSGKWCTRDCVIFPPTFFFVYSLAIFIPCRPASKLCAARIDGQYSARLILEFSRFQFQRIATKQQNKEKKETERMLLQERMKGLGNRRTLTTTTWSIQCCSLREVYWRKRIKETSLAKIKEFSLLGFIRYIVDNASLNKPFHVQHLLLQGRIESPTPSELEVNDSDLFPPESGASKRSADWASIQSTENWIIQGWATIALLLLDPSWLKPHVIAAANIVPPQQHGRVHNMTAHGTPPLSCCCCWRKDGFPWLQDALLTI